MFLIECCPWFPCVTQAGKYDDSLKHLEALQELNKEDYKITLNKAVVEFYKSSQTTTGTLKQTLMAMKNQVTAEMWVVFWSCFQFMLNLFSVKVLEEHSTLLLQDVLDFIKHSIFIFQVHTSAEDVDGLDDVENSLLYYNQAIIHYHMRQYSEAISIGERLYQFLEPFGMLWCFTWVLLMSAANVIR